MVAEKAEVEAVEGQSVPTTAAVVVPKVEAMRNWTFSLILVVLLVWIAGCGPEPIYAESHAIDPAAGWEAVDVQEFEFEVLDTLTPNDFFLDIRHNQDYPFSNLYLFVDYSFPNGRSRRDTVLCEFADERGKWLGTGSGPLVDHRIGFQRHASFPLKGTYKLSVGHAMRLDPLPGIADVGFRLEKSAQK